MKTYFATDGFRMGNPWAVYVRKEENVYQLAPRLDLANHSPTGYAWGYGGSGPAQLALAILADALGEDARALALHQRFKFRVIGALEQDRPWTFSQDFVLQTVRDLEAGDRRAALTIAREDR